MLPFRPLDITDKAIYKAYTGIFRTTDSSFAHQFVWSHFYDPQITEAEGFLLRTIRIRDTRYYGFPLGSGDVGRAVALMEADAQARQIPFILMAAGAQRSLLEQACPGHFSFSEDRNAADYIYRTDDLAALKGRKYHSKRNFVSRFEREQAGRWRFEALCPGHLPLVYDFLKRWCRKNDCASDPSLQEEAEAISLLLSHLGPLEALGGVLFAGEQLVAFTIGTPISDDTLDILVEKADYDVAGSYQMINREFSRRWQEHYVYFNREDDMGLEGLRKAKLSYHPAEICLKYRARPLS